MGKINPSIILFGLAGVLYFFSVIVGNEYLGLMTKPMIIPSIFVYYYFASKGKINFWFLISLFTFFVGDMLYLINIKEYYLLGLIIYLTPYVVVLFFLIQDIFNMLKRKTINKTDMSFLIILFFLIYLMISIMNVLDTESQEEFVYFLIFGIELVLMGVFATLLYVNENSRVNFFLIITVSLFIISDIFFILNKNTFPLLIFKLANVSSQIISYYFYTRYFIEKQKQLK